MNVRLALLVLSSSLSACCTSDADYVPEPVTDVPLTLRSDRVCEIYAVDDLLVATPDSPALTPEQLEVAVKGLVAPAQWDDPDTYALHRGQLIIQQPPFVHERIRGWLQHQRSARR